VIKIIIVDDHELVLRSWKELLENNPKFRVVATCLDAAKAFEDIEKLQPDIVLADIKMEPVNGFELTKKVVQNWPTVRVIGFSVHDKPLYARKIIALGGKGYITKTSTLEEINKAIELVARGDNYICEEIRRRMHH
jgi:two-component system invasion response regulator UvrY